MTEYELVDVINNVSSNMLAAQALFITVVSAYLVVGYSVGRNLTFYQVSFVNFAFILFSLISIQSAWGLTDMIFVHYEKLAEVRTKAESGTVSIEVIRAALLAVRIVLVVGALIFMWQVRHPKSE